MKISDIYQWYISSDIYQWYISAIYIKPTLAKAGMVHSFSGWTWGVQVKPEIPWERVPYLSALEVGSQQGAIQIHVYLTYLQCTASKNSLSWQVISLAVITKHNYQFNTQKLTLQQINWHSEHKISNKHTWKCNPKSKPTDDVQSI